MLLGRALAGSRGASPPSGETMRTTPTAASANDFRNCHRDDAAATYRQLLPKNACRQWSPSIDCPKRVASCEHGLPEATRPQRRNPDATRAQMPPCTAWVATELPDPSAAPRAPPRGRTCKTNDVFLHLQGCFGRVGLRVGIVLALAGRCRPLSLTFQRGPSPNSPTTACRTWPKLGRLWRHLPR